MRGVNLSRSNGYYPHTGVRGNARNDLPGANQLPVANQVPQRATPAPVALGIRVNGEKGTMEGRVATSMVGNQRVIELPGGIQLPAPAPGEGPSLLPIGETRLLSLVAHADGTVSVQTRDIGLEANKKGDKFKGTLLPDPETGKVDVAGKQIDVSGMQPGETKKVKIKIKGKKFEVKLRMNEDGTVSLEGKRKRGFFGKLFSGLGNILSKAMPVLSVVASLVPGLQVVGLIAKGWSLLQGGISSAKALFSGNILGGLAGLATSIAGGAKLFGANAFAAVADKVGKGLNFVANGWNALKNGVSSLFKGDILGGLAGITGGLAQGAGVVADWTRGAVQDAAQKVGGLFEKLSGTFGKVKQGVGFISNGLKALGSGNLLGGLASLATGLATGAKEVANWSKDKVKEVATQIGDVLTRVAKTLGMGEAALTAIRNGIQSFSNGRLAEGISSIFNALSTGASAAGEWMKGQAAKAAQNLANLMGNVSAGAAQVQGLMDAVKAKNPGAILQALSSAVGFGAGLVQSGAGQTAQMLQSISQWLGRAGNIVNDPKQAVSQLLVELGSQLVAGLIQSNAPQTATAGASSGNSTQGGYLQVGSDVNVGGYLPTTVGPGGEVLIAQASPADQSLLERVVNFFKGFGLGAWETFQSLGEFARNLNDINPILMATGALSDLIVSPITGKSPGQIVNERSQRAQTAGRVLLSQTRSLMQLAWDLSNPGLMTNFFNMSKAMVNELRSLQSSGRLNTQSVSQVILKHTNQNPSTQAAKTVLDAVTNYRAVINSGGSPEEIGKAAFRIFSLLAPFAKAKVANRPPPPGTTQPATPQPPPRPTGPFHSLSSLPGIRDITQFALGRLRGANGRAIPADALPDTVLYRGTSASYVQNGTVGVNPKGTGAYVMPDGSIKLASEFHASFEGGAGASYFSTNPNYALNYARQNGGVVVQVRVRDLQKLANEGKVVLAPDSAGSQHLVVVGPTNTRIPVTVSQP